MKKSLLVALLVFTSCYVTGEDIELYLGDGTAQTNFPPQVLIIFDNSGSMNGLLEDVRAAYDPNIVYDSIGSDNSARGTFTYYVKGAVTNEGIPVPNGNENRRFNAQINSCNTAVQSLRQFGFYTGYVREYEFAGNSGSWEEIPDTDGTSIQVLDCLEDVQNNDATNHSLLESNGTLTSLVNGFPVDNRGTRSSPQYHTSNRADSNVDWSGQIVTLYTDNYLRWLHDPTPVTQDSTKLREAQLAITSLLGTTGFADFALQVFNVNAFNENERDGGRVVFGFKGASAANRNSVVNIVNNQIDGETNTPLCETLYEASRYLRGQSVDYGDNDSSIFGRNFTYIANTPPRDTSVEANGSYVSPYRCNDDIHVIIITDGAPTVDNAADDEIAALPGIGSPFIFANGTRNYLPALAKWMNTNDLNPNIDGRQRAIVHTVGFGQDFSDEAVQLLSQTAASSQDGTFIQVDASQSSLIAALRETLANIAEQSGTLTSASVAANNFDRTETLDSVYYAMFQPENAPRWQGNLKKYRIVGSEQRDVNNRQVIDENGNFVSGAQSFWSSSPDGNDPTAGGVAEMLRNKANRKIVTNFSNALPELTLQSAKAFYQTDAALAAELDVTESEIDNTINWALGFDVDNDNDSNDNFFLREDVFGDPLHSRPLVVNYGGSSESNQDVRIIIGTNAGALHMFDDAGSTVDESWAFMPKEFFKNIKALRSNFSVTPKVYGLDGAITSYVNDLDGDGVIESDSGDQVWIFFGARRGGRIYYGLDISVPDSPRLLWQIDSSDAGFSGLGQSWAQPRVGFSKLNVAGGIPKPTLFISGGYDTNKDSGGVGTDDSIGVGAYMLDAETGALLWQLGAGAASATNTPFSGKDSIPGEVGILDSDSDGFIDRLYLADTGGHVWRVDMPGETPNASGSAWKATELASLGSRSDIAQDRRFFYEPAIVRTFISETVRVRHTDASGTEVETITRQEIPYEAILVSSGDRTRPLTQLTQDRLYMIKDENIRTQTFGERNNEPVPTVINNGDLYDFTGNPFSGNLTSQERQTLELAVSASSGWFVNLTETGEKGTSAAIAIDGTAFYTSYTPPDSTEVDLTNCRIIVNGGGVLYAIDLALGTEVFNFTNEANDGDADARGIRVGSQFVGSPTLIVTPAPGQKETESSTGNLITGRTIVPVGFKLRTSRISLSVEEKE